MCQKQTMIDYLIHIQYLGFRFHGWQRQPGLKTVESMLIKTLEWILGDGKFKILGASRTDAMVSALHSAFCLSLEAETDIQVLVGDLNLNLPADIRILKGEPAPPGFNIINSPRTKTYHYYFSFGKKVHPFCAPFLSPFPGDLDIERMKEGALVFEGEHDFRPYCTQPREQTRVRRRILLSRIEENRDRDAGFFPGGSWVYKVRSKGFMRNQVRLMMGQLVALGRGQIGMPEFEKSLSGSRREPFKTIAPASGLVLHHIEFEHDLPGTDPGGQGTWEGQL